MKWTRTKKTMNTQIKEDIATLMGDLRRVRAGLAARRRRQGTVAAAGGPEVQEVVTEMRERPAEPGEYAAWPRRHSGWRRVLGASLALGAVAFLLLRRSRRAGIRMEAPGPAVPVTPSPDRDVTVVPEETPVE